MKGLIFLFIKLIDIDCASNMKMLSTNTILVSKLWMQLTGDPEEQYSDIEFVMMNPCFINE